MGSMAGKASGRTAACGVAATFRDVRRALLWAKVGAHATRRVWRVKHTDDGWLAEPARVLTGGQASR